MLYTPGAQPLHMEQRTVPLPAELWYRKDTEEIDTVLLFDWVMDLLVLSCSSTTVYGVPQGAH